MVNRRLPSGLLFLEKSAEPPEENNIFPWMSKSVAVSLGFRTLTAEMREHWAPTLRQGNWLEMMGHKHTSEGQRSTEQRAN